MTAEQTHPLDLDAIRRRAEAATPFAWVADVPALIAEVERLRALLTEARSFPERIHAQRPSGAHNVDRCLACRIDATLTDTETKP